MTKVRTYQELRRFETFEDRFEYLVLRGCVGQQTFGFDRWLNQRFYTSRDWRWVRQRVILRDMGCDLGVPGYEIAMQLLIHHINPLTRRDIENGEQWILDPDFLITTSRRTHNAIHYGDRSLLAGPLVERAVDDTKLW